MSKPEPSSYVYFVLSPTTGHVKIGYSANHPDVRYEAFRTGCPVPLVKYGVIRARANMEARFHVRFRHLRVHGEWFVFNEEVASHLRPILKPWPKPQKKDLSLAALYASDCDPNDPVLETKFETSPFEGKDLT